MEFEFKSRDLGRLYFESGHGGGFPPEGVRAFRRRMQAIRAAEDERDLWAIRGNRFERLKGARSHEYSMRLNDQWRLILQIRTASPKNVVVIVAIVDYHR